MEITTETVTAWMDEYFKAVYENMGPLETVPNLGKLFTDDFMFIYYTPPANVEFTFGDATREQLFMQMVHPGLREVIEPYYYAINLEKLICVARFNDRTVDAGTMEDIVPAFQASAHYHLVPAEDTGLKIKRLEYFTSNQKEEDVLKVQEAWQKHQKPAFEGIVAEWLKARY